MKLDCFHRHDGAKASECGITMIHTYAAEIWKYTEDFDSYLGLDREEKIFCDGSFGSRSAKLYEPYCDDPSTDGIFVISQEDLQERVLKGYEMGLQPAIHAIDIFERPANV